MLLHFSQKKKENLFLNFKTNNEKTFYLMFGQEKLINKIFKNSSFAKDIKLPYGKYSYFWDMKIFQDFRTISVNSD